MANQLTLNSSALEELKVKVVALPEEKKIQANKTVSPTTSVQTILPDSGYDGLGSVTIEAASGGYGDFSEVTAQEKYVREGDVFIDANGDKKTGKLRFSVALGMNGVGFPAAYQAESRHDPNTSPNNPEFYYLSLLDQDFGTATPNHVLEDYTFSTNEYIGDANLPHFGKAVSGTMPNNGDTSQTIDGLETKSVTIPEGYTTGGTVTVDDTVDNIADTQAGLLEQIQSAIDSKSVPGGGSSGGNIETCTVTITAHMDDGSELTKYDLPGDVYYTTVENGMITAKCEASYNKTITCVCGSLLVIDEGVARFEHTYTGLTSIISTLGNNWVASGNVQTFKVTAAPNENATLDIEMD